MSAKAGNLLICNNEDEVAMLLGLLLLRRLGEACVNEFTEINELDDDSRITAINTSLNTRFDSGFKVVDEAEVGRWESMLPWYQGIKCLGGLGWARWTSDWRSEYGYAMA